MWKFISLTLLVQILIVLGTSSITNDNNETNDVTVCDCDEYNDGISKNSNEEKVFSCNKQYSYDDCISNGNDTTNDDPNCDCDEDNDGVSKNSKNDAFNCNKHYSCDDCISNDNDGTNDDSACDCDKDNDGISNNSKDENVFNCNDHYSYDDCIINDYDDTNADLVCDCDKDNGGISQNSKDENVSTCNKHSSCDDCISNDNNDTNDDPACDCDKDNDGISNNSKDENVFNCNENYSYNDCENCYTSSCSTTNDMTENVVSYDYDETTKNTSQETSDSDYQSNVTTDCNSDDSDDDDNSTTNTSQETSDSDYQSNVTTDCNSDYSDYDDNLTTNTSQETSDSDYDSTVSTDCNNDDDDDNTTTNKSQETSDSEYQSNVTTDCNDDDDDNITTNISQETSNSEYQSNVTTDCNSEDSDDDDNSTTNTSQETSDCDCKDNATNNSCNDDNMTSTTEGTPMTSYDDTTLTTSAEIYQCPDAIQQMSEAIINFSAKFLYELVISNPQKTVYASLGSPYIIIAVLKSFAVNETNSKLSKFLRVDDDKQLRCALRTFIKYGKNLSSGALFYAVDMFAADTKLTFTDEFKEYMQDVLGSDAVNVDFKNQDLQKINEVVASGTDNNIKEIVSPNVVNKTIQFGSFSAIYYQPRFFEAYNRRYTTGTFVVAPFWIKYMVPFTIITGLFNYTESRELGAHVLQLPSVGDESMLIILPFYAFGLRYVIQNMQIPDSYSKTMSKFKPHQIELTLPSNFSADTLFDSKDILQKTKYFKSGASESGQYEDIVTGNQSVELQIGLHRLILDTTKEQQPKNHTAQARNEYQPRSVNTVRINCGHPFVIVYLFKNNLPSVIGAYTGNN